jgi:hypothetical protein
MESKIGTACGSEVHIKAHATVHQPQLNDSPVVEKAWRIADSQDRKLSGLGQKQLSRWMGKGGYKQEMARVDCASIVDGPRHEDSALQRLAANEFRELRMESPRLGYADLIRGAVTESRRWPFGELGELRDECRLDADLRRRLLRECRSTPEQRRDSLQRDCHRI